MYAFDSRVRYSECDEKGELSLHGLVNYLQDCSTFHSEDIGALQELSAHHQAWLILAWQIEITSLPHLGDHIRVGTWCPGVKRMMAERDFVIETPSGDPYVKADSLWFVYDTDKGEPVRVPESQYVYLTNEPRVDLPKTNRHLSVAGGYQAASPVTVNAQHLDTNHHMNNAHYIQIALDAVQELEGEVGFPHRICAQYKRMALLGDTMSPRVHRDPEAHDPTTRVIDLASDADSYATVRLEDFR